MSASVLACIGLGGNLGDAAATLTAAAQRLAQVQQTQLIRVSRLYRTPAWGNQAQPDFINAVALVRTSLPAPALLDALLGIERAFGRDRSREQRWGPRTLDLDLLLYGDRTIDIEGLQVPHPRLHERAFALVPLIEVAPDAVIPGRGQARDAVSALDRSNIRPL